MLQIVVTMVAVLFCVSLILLKKTYSVVGKSGYFIDVVVS